ncbi:hypothetical protein [Burkholderia cenocepacia]|uniref:hypothetical protein n=1 Tax=Burkholderia cenocepacia TaxID=95486 RepID=UPI002863A997|nr:hypothetical protein [Burkholderia cenocepacia]MDR8054233.1 hypothetical protein [Burkholderia cenocepacia]MDR8064676.1 hypothetical protein [Burkholderia cenocepacia]
MTTTLPPQVDITPVTFNALRAAVGILADGHERAGNELEVLRAMVAQLSETVRAQAQQIAEMHTGFEEMRADFTGSMQTQEQAVSQQLSELGAEFEALNAELLDVEERAHARIDAAVAAAEVVYAKQQQIQAASINDKPVQVPVEGAKRMPVQKNAADLQEVRRIISQISTSSTVSITNQKPCLALRSLKVETPAATAPLVIEAPAPSVRDAETERALKKALRKVRRARASIARELRADEEEEYIGDDGAGPDENTVVARGTRSGPGWGLDDVRIDEEEELYA